ncbi:MAG: helix-turn-helix transcriptional regulator, partial [Candidatus Binatia bacterium]
GGLAAAGDRLIDALAPAAVVAPVVEPRVARALARLHGAPGDAWSATALAADGGLSLGRFAHLFRAATGVPVRRYILWTRLIAAVRAVSGGASLTTAAHAAGFADSAHLSRTFRRMFGIPPSALARGSTFVQALPPPVA